MVADLDLAITVFAADHVRDENLVETVAVQVAAIQPHREPAGFAKGQAGRGLKSSRAVVHPDSVG